MDTPWAVRNGIPLAQPGNIRMLDSITELVESGYPESRLSPFLAANGIEFLVVRNDTNPFTTGAPDAVTLHQSLDRSPGLVREAVFGPFVGRGPVDEADDGSRVLYRGGRTLVVPAVEIYRVTDFSADVHLVPKRDVPVVFGDPASPLFLTEGSTPLTLLAGDLTGDARRFAGVVVTDGLVRREARYSTVRDNYSAAMRAEDPYTLDSVEPNYRLYDDEAPYETTLGWLGVSEIAASSSRADADALGTIDVRSTAGAAMDRRPRTSWQSNPELGAVGAWWRVVFETPSEPQNLRLTMGPALGAPVTGITVHTDGGGVRLAAPDPGESVTVSLPEGKTSSLTVTADEVADGSDGLLFSLSEVTIDGVQADRALVLPSATRTVVPDMVSLHRRPGVARCVVVPRAWLCRGVDAFLGEDRDLIRVLTLPKGATFEAELTVRPGHGRALARKAWSELPVRLTTSSRASRGLAASPLALVDGDPATAWAAARSDDLPTVTVSWREARRLSRVAIQHNPYTATARPTRLVLRSGTVQRRVALEPNGTGRFRPFRADHVQVQVIGSERSYSSNGSRVIELSPGMSGLAFDGPDAPGYWSRELSLGCGSGPSLTIGRRTIPTAIEASLAQLLRQEAIEASLCSGNEFDLPSGTTSIVAKGSPASWPESILLKRRGWTLSQQEQRTVETLEWEDTSRAVHVGDRDFASLLVVSENFNSGWRAELRGRALTAVRVDGWKQAWAVPAGGAGTIVLTYEPQSMYSRALAVGIAGVVLAAVLVAWPPRGRASAEPSTPANGRGWVDLLLAGAALAAVSGWWGLAGLIAARLVVWRVGRTDAVGVVAGMLVGLGGAMQALLREPTSLSYSFPAQFLALSGVSLFAACLLANGPAFLRRRSGRSTQ
jgi:arabinofuranan 3-O-arabinosyltransferase